MFAEQGSILSFQAGRIENVPPKPVGSITDLVKIDLSKIPAGWIIKHRPEYHMTFSVLGSSCRHAAALRLADDGTWLAWQGQTGQAQAAFNFLLNTILNSVPLMSSASQVMEMMVTSKRSWRSRPYSSEK